jgi:hypothetical protein
VLEALSANHGDGPRRHRSDRQHPDPGVPTNTPMISDEAGSIAPSGSSPKSWRRLLYGSYRRRPGKSRIGAFSQRIGIQSCRPNKRPRRQGRRSPGLALRLCQSRRVGLSAAFSGMASEFGLALVTYALRLASSRLRSSDMSNVHDCNCRIGIDRGPTSRPSAVRSRYCGLPTRVAIAPNSRRWQDRRKRRRAIRL